MADKQVSQCTKFIFRKLCFVFLQMENRDGEWKATQATLIEPVTVTDFKSPYTANYLDGFF